MHGVRVVHNSCPLVVPREIWDATPSKHNLGLRLPVQYVVFHHFPTGNGVCRNFDTCAKTILEMQDNHMTQLGMSDIAYNFLISGDAMIWEGRGWEVASDPVLKYPQYNGNRIDIAYVGEANKKLKYSLLYNKAIELIDFGVRFNLIKESYTIIDKDPISESNSNGFGLPHETPMNADESCNEDQHEEADALLEGKHVMETGCDNFTGGEAENKLDIKVSGFMSKNEGEKEEEKEKKEEEDDDYEIKSEEADLMGMNEDTKRKMREKALMEMDQMIADEMDNYIEDI